MTQKETSTLRRIVILTVITTVLAGCVTFERTPATTSPSPSPLEVAAVDDIGDLVCEGYVRGGLDFAHALRDEVADMSEVDALVFMAMGISNSCSGLADLFINDLHRTYPPETIREVEIQMDLITQGG